MDHITLAGAPRIVEPAGNGATDFVNKLFDSGSVVPSICMFLGGAAIVICVVLLVIRKFWPNTTIGRQFQSTGTVIWCVAAIVLGIILVAPKQVVPFIVKLLAMLIQVLLDVIARIFGI